MVEGWLSSISSYAVLGLLLVVLAPLILIGYGWIVFFNTYVLAAAFLFQLSAPLVFARLIYRSSQPEDSVDYSKSAADMAFEEWVGPVGFFLLFALSFGFASWQFYQFVQEEGMPNSPMTVVFEKGIISGWLVALAILGYTWDAVTHER